MSTNSMSTSYDILFIDRSLVLIHTDLCDHTENDLPWSVMLITMFNRVTPRMYWEIGIIFSKCLEERVALHMPNPETHECNAFVNSPEIGL